MHASQPTKSKVLLGILIFLSMKSRFTPISSTDNKLLGCNEVVCGASRGPNVSRGYFFIQPVPENRKDKVNTANIGYEKLKLYYL